MRIFIISGESSGDQLGGLLAKELLRLSPETVIAGWGGRAMNDAGVKITKDINSLAFMGFVDVLFQFFRLVFLFNQCKKDITSFAPDKVIFIDFGSFNLHLARWVHSRGIYTIYYVPPKVWASRAHRISALKRYIDLVIVNFPFELDYLRSHGLEQVYFFGNPLVAKIKDHVTDKALTELQNTFEKPTIALLPGSRPGEIQRHMPVLIELIKTNPQFNWCIARATSVSESYIRSFIHLKADNIFITDDTYGLLKVARAGVICSGTASLEAALAGLPHVVIYKLHWFNYRIARLIIRVKYISLVNLIANRLIVKELIQNECNIQNLNREIDLLISDNNGDRFTSSFKKITQELDKKDVVHQIAYAIITAKY